MYRYFKPKAGSKFPTGPNKTKKGLTEYQNGTRRQRNSSFKRRRSLMNSFTRRKHPGRNPRANAIAAALKDPEVQKLHPKQKKVLDLMLEGKNVFFTGSAGTGKSHVLRLAVKHLETAFPRKVHITAPTGVAACNIGGTTIHSFSGIGLGDGDKETLLQRVRSKRIPRTRWKEAKVLVIDEVSMLSGTLFDSLAYIAQRIRSSPLPFGGLQLALCGDFFQLPPINAQQLCFQSEQFQHTIKHKIVLQKNFRQNDSKLIHILNQIRTGIVTPEAEKTLQQTAQRNSHTEDAVVPTRLFSHNQQVNKANQTAFRALKGKPHTFQADDYGNKYVVKSLQKNCQASQMLHLKVGAQVILLKNLSIESGLVNGSQGIVLEFRAERGDGGEEDKTLYPFVEFTTPYGKVQRLVQREEWSIKQSGETVATRSQVPLRLAWGLSIHKSQGMTIEKLEVNLGNVFEAGQAYVALSRCTSLDGLRVLGFNKSKIRADPRVIKFHREMGDLLSMPASSSSGTASKYSSGIVAKSWHVDSSSSTRKYTIMQLAGGGFKCTCPGFKFNGSCKHIATACSNPAKPATSTVPQTCHVDLTEEEAIMAEFGARWEAEAVHQVPEHRVGSQLAGRPPRKKTKNKGIAFDDEEAMVMAEYSAACVDEVPDEFLDSGKCWENSSSGTPKTTQETCYECHQPGHFASDCPSKTPAPKNTATKVHSEKQRECFSCGQIGHWSGECPLKSRKKRSTNSLFNQRNCDRGNRRANSVCFRCNQVGHYASACPTKSKYSR